MGRRVAFALIAALGLAGTSFGGLPKGAGLSAGVLAQWEKTLDRIQGGAGADRAQRYFRAVALLESGRAKEALTELSDLSGAKGGFSGAALEKLVEYAFEMARYEDVVRIGKDNEPPKLIDPDGYHYRLGQSLFLLGRHEEARGPLASIQGGRWKPYARHSLALIDYAAGDAGAAIERLGEALEAAQANQDHGVRRALLDRFRLLRGRIIRQASLQAEGINQERRDTLYKVAISQLMVVKEDSPLYGEALRTLGWCAVEMGDTARALAAFDTASTVDPEHAHEDAWATGRVFERLGFYGDAASSYAEAREAAAEEARVLEERSQGELTLPPSAQTGGWRIVLDRVGRLGGACERLDTGMETAEAAGKGHGERLDALDTALGKIDGRIEDLSKELSEMDKGLYHYLDVIPARSLFPKAERSRVDAILNRQEFLFGEIAKGEDILLGLQRTRAWERSTAERKERASALWARLNNSEYALSKSQLTFMEGVKTRVSVREKELVRLVDARKQENASLREPLRDNRDILRAERMQMSVFKTRLDALRARLSTARGKIDEMDRNARKAIEAQYRSSIALQAEGLRKRADEFSLDETQALHLLEESSDKKGAK